MYNASTLFNKCGAQEPLANVNTAWTRLSIYGIIGSIEACGRVKIENYTLFKSLV